MTATLCAGRRTRSAAGIAEWEALGLDHLALYFMSVEPAAIVRDVEWFVREIAATR